MQTTMIDQVDFLNLSPLFIYSLTTRLKSMQKLKEHLLSTLKTFQVYSSIGGQLCDCMRQLSSSFSEYEELQSDPEMKTISNLLLSFESSLSRQFSQISDNIIDPLKSFIKNEINDAEEKGKEANKNIQKYFKVSENYVMQKKKSQSDEADSKIMKKHKNAAFSAFRFHRALEFAERKKLIEIIARVCIFIFIFFWQNIKKKRRIFFLFCFAIF